MGFIIRFFWPGTVLFEFENKIAARCRSHILFTRWQIKTVLNLIFGSGSGFVSAELVAGQPRVYALFLKLPMPIEHLHVIKIDVKSRALREPLLICTHFSRSLELGLAV